MSRQKLTEHERQVNKKWSQYLSGAKTRGLTFELTKEEFEGLVTKSCYYCGEPPNPLNGIDRRNNDNGYCRGNVVPCCSICNMSKKVMTEMQWYQFIWRASEYIFRSNNVVPHDQTLEELGVSPPNYPKQKEAK
jgi:hypothetical protein